MKNFLYKLIFPESGKLYVGKATDEKRYGNNLPGDRFIGPHHNPEVQSLLDSGEFCFFHAIRQFSNSEEVTAAEDSYLKKVWKSDTWKSRPKWLLNRNRNSVGFSSGKTNPVHNVPLEKLQEQVKSLQTPEAVEKRRISYIKTLEGLETHWNEGRKRPDRAESNKSPETREKRRNKALQKSPCPHCGIEMNAGNLARHIRSKH